MKKTGGVLSAIAVVVALLRVVVALARVCGGSPPSQSDGANILQQVQATAQLECALQGGFFNSTTFTCVHFTPRAGITPSRATTPVLARTITPSAALTPLPCADEAQLRSPPDVSAATSVRFSNQTSQPATLDWLDYAGKRQAYATIAAGAIQPQPTFAGHLWLLAASDGSCLAIFRATQAAAEAVLTAR